MKTARFVLKIIAGSLALAAFVCGIIGFWDKLVAVFQYGDKVYRSSKADPTKPFRPAEYDDYADMGDYEE